MAGNHGSAKSNVILLFALFVVFVNMCKIVQHSICNFRFVNYKLCVNIYFLGILRVEHLPVFQFILYCWKSNTFCLFNKQCKPLAKPLQLSHRQSNWVDILSFVVHFLLVC